MSDEWRAYDRLGETGRGHATVNHLIHEWPRDDDGDGVREVHNNTIEGFWLGYATSCGPSGVSAVVLDNYVYFYACMHNFKWTVFDFLAACSELHPKRPMSQDLKGDLSVRPMLHQCDHRSRLTFCFVLAYCLQVTLKQARVRSSPGLTPRACWTNSHPCRWSMFIFPTTDGRTFILLSLHDPEADLKLLCSGSS